VDFHIFEGVYFQWLRKVPEAKVSELTKRQREISIG